MRARRKIDDYSSMYNNKKKNGHNTYFSFSSSISFSVLSNHSNMIGIGVNSVCLLKSEGEVYSSTSVYFQKRSLDKILDIFLSEPTSSLFFLFLSFIAIQSCHAFTSS